MLYSLISFLLSLFFVVLGIIMLIIPWSYNARTDVILFMLDNPLLLTLIGTAFVIIGALTFFNLIQNTKRKYFTFKSNKYVAEVSDSIIQKHLINYFRDIYPYKEIPCEVELKSKKALIVLDLPYTAEDEQKELLKKIESDLTTLFRDTLGYRNELKVSISFSPE